MTEDRQQSGAEPEVDEAALAQDLEIKDGEEADAIRGGETFKMSLKHDPLE
jgi:hypothetical protein